jgi:hypothetical protein
MKEVLTPENSEGVLTDNEEVEENEYEQDKQMPSEQTLHIDLSSLRDQHGDLDNDSYRLDQSTSVHRVDNSEYENIETSQFNIIKDDVQEPAEVCAIAEEDDSLMAYPKDFQNNSVVYKGSSTVSNNQFDQNMLLSFSNTLDKDCGETYEEQNGMHYFDSYIISPALGMDSSDCQKSKVCLLTLLELMFSTKNKTNEIDQETFEKDIDTNMFSFEGNYYLLTMHRNKNL